MARTGDGSRRSPGRPGREARELWLRRNTLARADIAASILAALAIAFCAGPLLRGLHVRDSGAFIGIAPLVGALYFVAMIFMFAEQERRGVARALLAGGAVVLAVSAVLFGRSVPAGRVLLSYWAPALLGMLAALVLFRGHQLAGTRARAWERLPPPRPGPRKPRRPPPR